MLRIARFLRTSGTLFASAAACLLANPACAQDEAGFQAYLQPRRARASARGVPPAPADSMLPGLTLNPRVIELDRQQPGGNPSATPPPFAPYRAQHVDASRITRGRAAYQAERARLSRIEA